MNTLFLAAGLVIGVCRSGSAGRLAVALSFGTFITQIGAGLIALALMLSL